MVPNPKPCFERLAPISLDSESRQNADSQKIASDSTSVILLGHPTGTGRICFLPERLALATSSHCTFSQLVCCHVVCLPGFNESRLVYDSNDVSNIASLLRPCYQARTINRSWFSGLESILLHQYRSWSWDLFRNKFESSTRHVYINKVAFPRRLTIIFRQLRQYGPSLPDTSL